MAQSMTMWLMTAANTLGSVLIMAALGLLWSRFKSSWLLVTLAGAAFSLLLRLFVAVVPTAMTGSPALALVWAATYLLEAAGWLGFALEQTQRKT